jgi:diacylglycerol kinase (ATP)
MPVNPIKLLFIINPGSGSNKNDWGKIFPDFFKDKPSCNIELFELPRDSDQSVIRKKIDAAQADIVVAVGGDGTVKLVAESLQNTKTALGIIPAGSANGLAKELGIPEDPEKALELLIDGNVKTIHLTRVNDQLCIHLSDMGFNAYLVKKFEDEQSRGMWGYLKAAFRVIWQYQKMSVRIQTDKEEVSRMAAMVVIANATKYGNGVVINPLGSLYDNMFEVVVIRKISLAEIFKMRFWQKGFDPAKTEFFQTRSLNIQSKHHVYFQVDGEVMRKTKSVKAEIRENALKIVVPKNE